LHIFNSLFKTFIILLTINIIRLMAKSVTSRVDYLTIDKNEFRLTVAKRLEIGKEIIERKIGSLAVSNACWAEFIKWDFYNLEMIRNAFEFPDNVHANTYDRNRSMGGGIYFSGEERKEPTIQEKIESVRGEMSSQVWKLERFYEKIELFKVKIDTNQLKTPVQSKLDNLLHLLKRFHKVCQEFRSRRSEREPLVVKDEYDVQYLLGSLLKIYFDDIRTEEYSPSNSGANTRIDFALKEEKIIIETKMTKDGQSTKSLGEELLIDIGRYKSYTYCKSLVIFIYDKGDNIVNKRGFANDIESQGTENFNIFVVINPY
jgi:REase_DpnII-MboI